MTKMVLPLEPFLGNYSIDGIDVVGCYFAVGTVVDRFPKTAFGVLLVCDAVMSPVRSARGGQAGFGLAQGLRNRGVDHEAFEGNRYVLQSVACAPHPNWQLEGLQGG